MVTIIGRNGAGKTTTLRAIMGLLDKRSGSINVWGREVIADPPERIAKLGVGYVPEERGIYATLDVTENLLLPPRVGEGGMTLEEIFELFPEPARAAPQPRHAALGRRATDACDRARAAHRGASVPA